MKKEGFENIYTAENGKLAIDLFEKENPDLAILDVMLSDRPILFLSAKGEELDRVMGLAIEFISIEDKIFENVDKNLIRRAINNLIYNELVHNDEKISIFVKVFKRYGLVMAIVREIINVHDGNIRIDSKLGKGTHIEIIL